MVKNGRIGAGSGISFSQTTASNNKRDGFDREDATFGNGTMSVASYCFQNFLFRFPFFSLKYQSSETLPCHETMPSLMIFRRVLDLQELKNQVSQSFRPSHDD